MSKQKNKQKNKPKKSFFDILGRTLLGLGLLGLLLAIIVPVGAYLYVAKSLPRVDTLADYRPPIITRVYSDDKAVIAELFEERRIIVPVSRMPKQLVQAFVAAEDSNFFKHKGIDIASILRAAIKNVKAGGIVQGGSTITQQVAKSLLLTPERKFKRKFKEAILAYRMEKRLSKEEILYLYLNQIFLGHGAHGVQAAAENYFDKDVENLTLAECSILAGLPKAPSRYSPYRHYDRAKDRQIYVLGRMVSEGFISQTEADEAMAQELQIRPRINQHITDAAYFTEQVRRYLEDTYGEEQLYRGGLEVYTSMNLQMQLAAQAAVQANLRDHDKRQGYRGPLLVLSAEQETEFLSKQAETFAEKQPVVDDIIEAVISGADKKNLHLRIAEQDGRLLLKSAKWAGPPQLVKRTTEATGNATEDATRLPLGAKVAARIVEIPEQGPWQLTLEQEPLAQGALLATDPHTGQIKVMVGG